MFELHHDGPCLLCKGAEDHDQFDYCRGCGYTLFHFKGNDVHKADLRKLVEELRFEANAIQPMDVGSSIKAQAKADVATRIEELLEGE